MICVYWNEEIENRKDRKTVHLNGVVSRQLTTSTLHKHHANSLCLVEHNVTLILDKPALYVGPPQSDRNGCLVLEVILA